MNKDDLIRFFEEEIRQTIERDEKYQQEHPIDVPNDVCNHAFLTGIKIENSFMPRINEINFLFKLQFETIYVWTCIQNKESVLLSKVDTTVKEKSFWKTALRLLQLSFSYIDAFQNVESSYDYKFIYNFSHKTSNIDNIELYNFSKSEYLFEGTFHIIKATDVSNIASIIELLERDDRAYISLSLVHSSFLVHNFCLICELSDNPWHDHITREPEIWEQSNILQNLELAIVQSCRAVEALVGQPPNRKKAGKVDKFKAQWEGSLGFSSDDEFKKAGKSYLDFYYDLFFDLRNPSAHCYGNIEYRLARKRAVEAQCFAALLIKNYIRKNEISNEKAIEKLSFNKEFLSRVREDLSTPMTVNE